MTTSGLTEGPEVSSTLSVAPLLKRGQAPDAELSTKIFQEFDEKTKDCWPLGRFYIFEVDIYRCHGAPSTMNVRAEEKDRVKWQMNNIMNNPKGDRQTICVTPKDPKLPVTRENWEEIKRVSSTSSMASTASLQRRFCSTPTPGRALLRRTFVTGSLSLSTSTTPTPQL